MDEIEDWVRILKSIIEATASVAEQNSVGRR
jgi:hypothetical protein